MAVTGHDRDRNLGGFRVTNGVGDSLSDDCHEVVCKFGIGQEVDSPSNRTEIGCWTRPLKRSITPRIRARTRSTAAPVTLKEKMLCRI